MLVERDQAETDGVRQSEINKTFGLSNVLIQVGIKPLPSIHQANYSLL